MSTSSPYRIAVIKGDGIGPEIVSSAMKVLSSAAARFGFGVEYNEVLAGGCAIDACGVPLPSYTLDACRASDAVLLGAVGGPKWDGIEPSRRPERALLGLRSGLGLYANLRPALLFPELASASPLKNAGAIDILIVRELTGGIYFGENGSYESSDLLADGTVKGKVAYDTEAYSEGEIRRIVKQAFEFARGRGRKLTLVDKANVLASSRLWREVASSVASDYPDVALDFLYVDNCTMQLIGRPSSFDVIVTSNMFGDIISDEAGMITGSIGMLPSASLGAPETPGMYEPIHGSAPDIAGTGKANPLATILSAAMMLRWSLGEKAAADAIEDAVKKVVADGYRTPDIASGADGEISVDTDGMTEAVLKALG
ncbi:3-isopropylmalate dehydrogenase [Ruminococcaceae bacterium YRB3002]|nr:3-isopropylmalate dehydrogenase [Ruminococcaceae bacterium YRB3002]